MSMSLTVGVSCAKTDGQSATSSSALDVLHFDSTSKIMLSHHVLGFGFHRKDCT